MTLSFESDNDVIIYALKKIIGYARRTQQIFVAQCIWWLASVIGLESGLALHIDKLHGRIRVDETPNEELPIPQITKTPLVVPPEPRDIQEENRQDKILADCEQYLLESRRHRNIVTLKAKGKSSTGRINPTPISKKSLWKKDRKSAKRDDRLEGINLVEVERRRASGECLCCAWPSDRKGQHQYLQCRRAIKLDKGTAGNKKQPTVEEASSEEGSSQETSEN
jgi:hypothetical protein